MLFLLTYNNIANNLVPTYTNTNTSEELNYENLVKELKSQNLYSEWVLKQIAIETGWLTSNACVNHNNLFGIGYIDTISQKYTKRKVYASEYFWGDVGKTRKVASYNCWKNSIRDFKSILDYHLSRGKDTSNYIEYINQIGYSTDSSYTNLMLTVNVKNFNRRN